jgi:tetratricopeptide (TPR) repeat protein
MRNTLTCVIALALCVAVGACADPETRRKKYIASGDAYMKQGNVAAAIIQYSNAVSKVPASGEAHLRLAEAYVASNQIKPAFPEFIRAADLLPDDLQTQLKAGHFLLKAGLFQEAKARARIVLEHDANNVDALLLLANSLAGMRSLDEAVNVIERAVGIDPERAGTYTNLGVLELAQGDREQAEATFKRAVDASKGSAESYVGLGNFYRVIAQEVDAEKALKRALDVDPKNVPAHEAIASLYVEWGKAAQAEPYLKSLVSLSPTTEARLALADFYSSVGRQDDAIKTLQDMSADPKQFATAQTRIALIEYEAGRRQHALEIVDAVLAKEPRRVPALTMKARLLLADGNAPEALALAKRAVDIDPRYALGHLTLGRILLARNDIENARRAFNDTLEQDPDSLPAQLELIEIHRGRGELDTALQFADQAIRTHPTNMSARIERIKILLVREPDRPRAEADLKTLLAKFPNAPAVYVLKGSYYLTLNNTAAAREAFQRALDLNPTYLDAVTGLVALDISTKNPAAARARIEAILVKYPDAPTLRILAARVYALSGDAAKAEDSLKRAMKADPSNPEPYGLLAQLYMSQGKIEEAKREFAELARVDPRSVGAPTMLGVLYYATKQQSEAQQWWEKALKIDGRSAAAANNLAWLYAESGTNLDRALDLAKTAKATMPDQPEMNDTLGWVYYKQKLYTMAVQYLLVSQQKEPNNPIYQFHVGMAYAQAGEDAKARKYLQRALEIDPKFDGAAEAKKTLLRLIY